MKPEYDLFLTHGIIFQDKGLENDCDSLREKKTSPKCILCQIFMLFQFCYYSKNTTKKKTRPDVLQQHQALYKTLGCSFNPCDAPSLFSHCCIVKCEIAMSTNAHGIFKLMKTFTNENPVSSLNLKSDFQFNFTISVVTPILKDFNLAYNIASIRDSTI